MAVSLVVGCSTENVAARGPQFYPETWRDLEASAPLIAVISQPI